MMKIVSLCAFVSLCVPLCAFSQDMQPIQGYAPVAQQQGYGPAPMPYAPPAQPQAYPMPMPGQPIVVQSANDSAMLEAVKQGKGFNLRVDLIDRQVPQYQYPQYQYQPQAVVVTPYCQQQNYCQQSCVQHDCYGRPIYWDGYRWRYYQQQQNWYPGCNLGF